MKIKEETNEKFIVALFSLVQAIKKESDNCGKVCGGLNEKELVIVYLVGQRENINMSEIAASLDAPLSTLTNVVNGLVAKNILSREHSIEDRRVVNVFLNEKGKMAYKTMLDQKKNISQKVLAQFDDKTQDLFIRHMLASSLNNK